MKPITLFTAALFTTTALLAPGLSTPRPQPRPARAPAPAMREFPCEILRAIDGDTFVVSIDLGFSITLADQRVRLLDVDAYETNTARGLEADILARSFVGPGVFTSAGKRDSFGRILGRLAGGGRDIGAALEAADLVTGRWAAPQQPSR